LNLLSEYGCSSLCEFDLNQDGLVAVDDLLQVLSVYGYSCE
jgi:Ca2+-binding EF-hand superfamily protein